MTDRKWVICSKCKVQLRLINQNDLLPDDSFKFIEFILRETWTCESHFTAADSCSAISVWIKMAADRHDKAEKQNKQTLGSQTLVCTTLTFESRRQRGDDETGEDSAGEHWCLCLHDGGAAHWAVTSCFLLLSLCPGGVSARHTSRCVQVLSDIQTRCCCLQCSDVNIETKVTVVLQVRLMKPEHDRRLQRKQGH